ncbi:aminoglycoside phosphotransferase family protein [Goodfellowiella coeruleoviolacea]|uniref:Ser/Thr protein kinase RdoA involved in Cpx stress response, MazF antagonist n=1 Tax=Goodfellowiella coeruleoviolacea TaxID=334858 RepID=A0AAE3GF72_9PSEU|nr:phosphotransferase [Goodfellowiella coeruleoviolacea]MCP2165043.1 Ser/Thr protein kinase RdoA involved in Cpx stress response, MazF antagonist [Goodfellowiella coeruleoviolacea]
MTNPDPSDNTVSDRAAHAVRLATEAGRQVGLRATEPRVLHDVFNVLVHLAPDPVVVRVPSLSLASVEEQAAKQRRELAVTGWLADRGAPVVRPSPLVPDQPVAIEGKSLTFWEFVSETEPMSELVAAGDMARVMDRFVEQTGWVAHLHDLLADYPGELPVLSPVGPELGRSLAELTRQPHSPLSTADLDRAQQEHAVLETLLADLPRYFPDARVQALHGDAPAYNVLRTATGHLFSDFEDTTRGPVEWDLIVGVDSAAAVAAYERAGGRRVDPVLLRVMDGARRLQATGALALVPLMPELGPMLEPVVAQWRDSAPLALDSLG